MKLLRQLYPSPDESVSAPNDNNLLNQTNGTPAHLIMDANSFNDPELLGLSPQQQAAYKQVNNHNPTGALPESAYYPTMNQPINVGNYSGSEIGSTTLFAPSGGVLPLGMMDARDAAVHHAALSKLKEADEWKNKYKTPETSLTNIQPHITKEYMGYIDVVSPKRVPVW